MQKFLSVHRILLIFSLMTKYYLVYCNGYKLIKTDFLQLKYTKLDLKLRMTHSPWYDS